jgi:hypothetical protein
MTAPDEKKLCRGMVDAKVAACIGRRQAIAKEGIFRNDRMTGKSMAAC